ncbi:Fatty-acid-CoA ligase [Phytophthora megakarya]|uniref:Fatty-acid-CoA ligase n=1 Tax=Phytophthora megakarya TaxID=4795 RepID=A0A225WEJ6_9STRA|nr:Fatty-acid-CoA ligase [Phytophthora megakarya]
MSSELLERVEKWAVETPSKMMLSFVDDKGVVTSSLTCAELNKRVQNVAGLLTASSSQLNKGLGLKQGDRVLVVYPPTLDFIVAFLACLKAGVVAVPVYPPDPRKMKKDISMFVTVTQNCQAKTALTCSMYYNLKKISTIKEKFTFSNAAQWPDHLAWVVTDDLVDAKWIDPTKHWLTQSPSADNTAFLQYTSGSTSAPKGVVLSHGNLNHNLRTISSALHAGRDTVVVSWLPQYHDMGLIGAYLGTIFNGGTGIYMSPFSFIRNPCLWLRLVSKHRATHLQAPNFAYSLLARKSAAGLASGERIDLSSVRHMINGAEPIQGEVIDNFYRAFSPFGLLDGVVKPTYGLAEHTVYVCGGGKQRLWVDKQALESDRVLRVVDKTNTTGLVKEMIGCGVPSRKDYGIDVRIVDAETGEEKPEGETGEVWISSPSKAQGYYGDEMRDFSAEAFQATVIGDTEGRTFLKTGDLGVIYNQELFISFSYVVGNDEDEKLAVIGELRDPAMTSKASLCGNIRSAIAREHGVKVTLVVLLAPRSIPKTTSGKISRSRCKKALEEKKLEELYRNEDMIADIPVEDDGSDEAVAGETIDRNVNGPRVAPTDHSAAKSNLPTVITGIPPDQVHAFLVKELAQTLGVETSQINDNTPLQELGFDSMALTQLQGVIAQKYQVHVEEELLYGETTTLASLHAGLCGGASGNRTGASSAGVPKQKLFCGCIAC